MVRQARRSFSKSCSSHCQLRMRPVLKVHLHKILPFVFFHKKKAPGPLISTLVYFQIYVNSNSPIYSNSKVITSLSEYGEWHFFAMLEQYQKLFLFGYRSNSSPSMHFLKYCPFKICEEKSFIPNIQMLLAVVAEYAEWKLTYADNTWNEIYLILINPRNEIKLRLKIRGMKLSAYW